MDDKDDQIETLRASEERYRALCEMSFDWFWETDKEHRFTFLSIEKTIGRQTPRSAMIGKTRREASPDSMTVENWAIHDQTLAARQPLRRLQTRAINPDTGAVLRLFSLSGQPRFDAHGEFIGYRGFGRDITEIRRAERVIAESETRLRLITQNIQDIVALMKLDGNVIYLSPSYALATGRAIKSSLGGEAIKFFYPHDVTKLKAQFARCVRKIDVHQSSEMTYRFRHADGRQLWLEGQFHLVRGKDGMPLHVLVSARDVTAKRLARLALEEKSRDLNAANAALEIELRSREELERNILLTIEKELAQVGLELHDGLGQELTGIALLTKTLALTLADKNAKEATLAAQISALANRTISHTRMIAHGLSPFIDGNNGLAIALRQLTDDVNSLGVVQCIAEMPSKVTIDDEVIAFTLYRIAQEAVNNALKHSGATKIVITLTSRSGIELVVKDNGVGYVPDNIDATNNLPLRSIRHRCRAIDATLTIRAGKSRGTIVRVMLQGADSSKSASRELNEQGP